jgi:predicted ATPase/DNA-binding CsgD family transcriptional regulator
MEQTAQILSRIARQTEARDALDSDPQAALSQDGWHLLTSSPAGRPTPIQPSSPLFGRGHHNLPAQPTALRGRDRDLETAGRQLLRDDVRLLTLTGPAGTGKTRLGVALAESVIDFFTDGVFFIDLARIDDPALASAAIAETLQIRQQRGLSLEDSLRDALREAHTLLILDNFEHIVPAASQVAALLAACPRVKILVTSRATLRLRWEHQYPVRTLGLPAHPDLAEVAASPAAVLFVERAQAADPHFELTEDNAADISELCARLDGLPLAIELAAARARLLPPRKLLARLRHRLDLLNDGAADLPTRQQSLRRAIDYSFDLLPSEEQALFCRVALFPGGCTPEAAVALGRAEITADEDDGFELAETLDRLASLVHKSLLHEEQLPDDEVRFRMLEIVRDYALEKLAARGELEETRGRWIAYFVSLADLARKGMRSHTQGSWLERLDREHDNLRAAIRWCLESGDAESALQLASSAWRFWYARGLYSEGRQWLSQVLAMPGAGGRTRLRARALNAASNLAYYEGDYAAAEALQQESLAIRRELDNRRGAAHSLDTLALLALQQNDSARATTLLEESLGIKRELGDEWGIANSLQYLAELSADQGHLSAARARFEESLLRFQTLGDAWSIAAVLESMAGLAQAQGQSDRSIRLAGAAAGLRTSLGASGCSPVRRMKLQRTLEAAQRALGANAATVRAEGQAMSVEDAVLFARSTTTTETVTSAAAAQPSMSGASLGTSSELAWLTPREREVSGLLLRGLSNRQIADELVITERTAETHVCRILSKLGLGSRAQIAAWALDHGLLESRAS